MTGQTWTPVPTRAANLATRAASVAAASARSPVRDSPDPLAATVSDAAATRWARGRPSCGKPCNACDAPRAGAPADPYETALSLRWARTLAANVAMSIGFGMYPSQPAARILASSPFIA